MKRFLLYFLAFLGLNIGSLQAQTDEPCGATALTVNASCSGLTGLDGAINPPAFTNSTSATAGVTLPSLSCNGFTTTTLDFWFTVVVPASGSVTVTVESGSGASPSNYWDMALYGSSSATCAASTFTQLASSCVAQTAPSLKVSGQTAGSIVYVRVWREAVSVQTAVRTYFIYAADGSIPPPACPTAYVSPAQNGTNVTSPYFVWQQSADVRTYDFYLGGVNLGTFRKSIYTNDTISVPYASQSSGTIGYLLPPATATTWYVQPSNCANAATNCSSGARSFTSGSAPPNDNCSGAFLINPGIIYSAPSAYATQSQVANATCTSAYAADVWFRFKTNATGGAAKIEAASLGGFNDLALEVFSGTCGSLTSVNCVDNSGDEQLDLTGLAPNTTYYVRIYTYTSATVSSLWGDGYLIRLTGTAVIPVELTMFDGKAQVATNFLTWQTATERGVNNFVIERSANGDTDFKAIGTVKAAGNSNSLKDYTFIDQEPAMNSYYRLKTVDVDGKDALSKIISIQRKAQKLTLTKVFPTPASDVVTVQFESPSAETVKLTVTDFLGRVVVQKTMENTEGVNEVPVNIAELPVGAYFVQLVANGQQTKGKFVKN